MKIALVIFVLIFSKYSFANDWKIYPFKLDDLLKNYEIIYHEKVERGDLQSFRSDFNYIYHLKYDDRRTNPKKGEPFFIICVVNIDNQLKNIFPTETKCYVEN